MDGPAHARTVRPSEYDYNDDIPVSERREELLLGHRLDKAWIATGNHLAGDPRTGSPTAKNEACMKQTRPCPSSQNRSRTNGVSAKDLRGNLPQVCLRIKSPSSIQSSNETFWSAAPRT
jgi:hypothetical protein